MGADRRRYRRWLPVFIAIGVAVSACSADSVPSVAPTPVVTVTATVTEAPASGISPAEPSAPPSGTKAASEAEQLQQVDPEKFFGTDPYRDDGYFFTSPSKNLSCGLLINNGALTGCQAWSLVDNLPECDAPLGASSPAIEFDRGRPAEGYCLTDGAFSAEAPVLEYGQQLTVDGISCTSRDTGVTCLDESSGLGFTAARAGFVPIR